MGNFGLKLTTDRMVPGEAEIKVICILAHDVRGVRYQGFIRIFTDSTPNWIKFVSDRDAPKSHSEKMVDPYSAKEFNIGMFQDEINVDPIK